MLAEGHGKDDSRWHQNEKPVRLRGLQHPFSPPQLCVLAGQIFLQVLLLFYLVPLFGLAAFANP
jgi:hypothetical protein